MSRLFGVMLIYLTRPLCWVLFVIVATALFVGWSFRSDEYVNYAPGGVAEAVSKFLDYRQRVDSLETLNAVLENQDTQAVAVHYGSLARDLEYGNVNLDDAGDRSQEIIPKDEVAERLEKLELPRLTQSLTTGVWQVRQSTIEQLGNVGSLEHIDFLIPASNKVSLDLSPFSKLLNLKTLNLGQLITIESLTPLQALPKLETLTIGNHQFVTAKHLREIAAIKSLRQLFLPDVTNNPAAMAALSELKSSSLERVYISIPPSETAKLQAISSAIPSLRVRSSKYLLMRCLGCGVVMWMILMINGVRHSLFISVYTSRCRANARLSSDSTAFRLDSYARFSFAGSWSPMVLRGESWAGSVPAGRSSVPFCFPVIEFANKEHISIIGGALVRFFDPCRNPIRCWLGSTGSLGI